MTVLLACLVALAMLTTVGILLGGMVGLARNGDDPMRSNRLMRYRVMAQAVAVVLFLLLMSLGHR
jgi:hypothetical protein